MTTRHTCGANGCARPASDRCFECGGRRCEAHLTHAHLPTFDGRLHEALCDTCLQGHLAQPDPYGRIEIDALPPPIILA